MNADLESLKCPVCGTEMKPDKQFHGLFHRTVRYRCTCGHYEDHDRLSTRHGAGELHATATEGLGELW